MWWMSNISWGCCKRSGKWLDLSIDPREKESNSPSKEIWNIVPKHCNPFSKVALTRERLRAWAQDRLSRFLESQEADSAFDEMVSVVEKINSKEGRRLLQTKANEKVIYGREDQRE